MKKFCKDLTEHTAKIINYEKKKMVPLTMKEEISKRFVIHVKKNLIRTMKKL